MHTEKHITKLRKLLQAQGYICSLWHITDVKEVRPDLTDAQCMQVLERCQNSHDACAGINWDVIEIHADDMFPEEQPSNTEKGGR